MQTKETIVVTVFYCDVCGAKCGNGMTTYSSEGEDDQHACAGANEQLVRCTEVLEDRILKAMRSRKKDSPKPISG